MARLVARNIEERVKAALQRRARRHGPSMEEEVREILRNAVNDEEPARGLGTAISSMFGEVGLVRDLPELRGERIRGADLDA